MSNTTQNELKNVVLILKNGSSAGWVSTSYKLQKGELGIEYLENGKVKIKAGKLGADGQPMAWVDLPYIGADEIRTHYVDKLASAPTTGNNIGDVTIVKETIYKDTANELNSKYSYTAYVWAQTGTDQENKPVYNWSAMDGNYSAGNVFLPSEILLAGDYGKDSSNHVISSIGNLRKGDTIAAGTSVEEVFNKIFTKEINTDLKNTAPSCTMSGNSTKYYLVGAASEEQTITLGLGKGSYDYGYGYLVSKDEIDPAEGTKAVVKVTNDGTGVVTQSTAPYALTWNGSSVSPTTTNGNVFKCGSVTKTERAELKCSGTVKYINAGNPISNVGNIYPAQAYADGTSSANTQTLAKWYYPIYQGFTYESTAIADPANITAAQLKALGSPVEQLKVGETTHKSTNKNAVIVGSSAYDKQKISKAIAEGPWRQYFLAYPTSDKTTDPTYYNYNMSGAKDINNLDLTIKNANNVEFDFNGVKVTYKVQYIHNGSDYGTRVIQWNI